MSHNYNTRTKKESVVISEWPQTLEANIINNINSLKDKIIRLKDAVIKLQEENVRLCDKCQQLENRVVLVKLSHDALEQYGRRNNLVIFGIPDSVQDSYLESTVTSILWDIDVNVESREVEDATELVNLIMVLKRPLLDSSIGNIARKHYLTGSNWRELIWKNISL